MENVNGVSILIPVGLRRFGKRGLCLILWEGIVMLTQMTNESLS